MSTVTPPDGTTIDHDRYGDGPAVVVVIGGATQHRALDPSVGGSSATARPVR